jgi:hypothetical protein
MLLLLLLLVLLAPSLACFHCRQAFCQRLVLGLLETLMWRVLLLQSMMTAILTMRLLHRNSKGLQLLLRVLLLLLRQLVPWSALDVLVGEQVRQGTCRLPAQLEHKHKKDRSSNSSIQACPQAYQSAC